MMYLFIIVANIIVFMLMSSGVDTSRLVLSQKSETHTLITSMFLHSDLMHLIGNMLTLYFFKRTEEQVGTIHFIYIYLLSGIIGNVFTLLFGIHASIGASGAIMGIIGLDWAISIASTKKFFQNNPQSKTIIPYLVMPFVIIMTFLLPNLFADNINNVAHIFGFITGFLYFYCFQLHENVFIVAHGEQIYKNLKDNTKE